MILGHERQIEYLEKVLKNGRISHAYLFHGPESVGKLSVAKSIAEKLPCPYPIILDLENTLVSKKDKRKDIPIEDIRELKRMFALAAPEGEWRIAIINEAEKLSPEAGDAFLKLLEEPGEKTLFLLVTSAPDLLGQTILSRAQPIRFSLVPDSVLSGYLAQRGVLSENQKEILHLAVGRPGAMIRMLEDKTYLDAQKKLLRSVHDILRNKDFPQAFSLAEKVASDDEERRKVIEYVVRMVRAGLLKAGAAGTAPRFRALRAIIRMAEVLDTTNVNPCLAMDTIFLEALAADPVKL